MNMMKILTIEASTFRKISGETIKTTIKDTKIKITTKYKAINIKTRVNEWD